jgi:peptidoglycan/xylan/chitin deacetylase (PgdA/CDA1 family)
MKIPILMYHYVRPSHRRLSSRHNVLDLELYDQQLNALAANHSFILGRDLVGETKGIVFEQRNIWLTFDDGYRDCVEYALPSLLRNGATATFYIPTEAIFNRKLLDVNKIHILLSSHFTPTEIVEFSRRSFDDLKIEVAIGQTFDELFTKNGIENLWNDKDTEFIKKLFQKLLPAKLRKQLLERVFNQLVDRSESSWVDEFYMTPDDLQRLVDNGMEVGSHGHSHEWLGEMSTDAQEDEITRSFELLSSINNSFEFKTICYPFGSYNDETIRILRNQKVCTGVLNRRQSYAQVEPDVADHLELDRIDVMFFDKFMNGEFQ